MAANMVETQIEGATDVGAQERQGRGHGIGAMGLAAAALIAALFFGITLHNRQAAHSTAAVPAPMMSEQQRTLEESETSAATVPYYRTINGSTFYDRLTSQGASSTGLGQRVCYDGSAVLLTCYTRQPDGLWERTEMQEDTTWVVVGTVTDDEMQTAVAAANARVS